MIEDQTVLEAKRIGVLGCKTGTTLGEAARYMVSEDVSALVVTDAEGCLAGIISRTDLLRALLASSEWDVHTIDEYMIVDVITVTPQTRLSQVAELLLQKHIHRVVVVRDDDGKPSPISVVSAGDLVYHMVKNM
jgi:CBS domain-containing protein